MVSILALPAYLYASTPQAQQPNEVAHGAEKVSHEVAHPNEPHGGPHEEPTLFGIPYWIWKFANMLLFIGFLSYFIVGPVKRAFSERGEKIRGDAQEARERRAKADQMAADIQARLGRVEGDLQAILERARVEGERQKQELIVAAEAEAKKIIQNAQSEVDNRLRHARSELTEYAGQLAAERAEQILRDKITDADQQKLFRESLTEVEGARS
jgi:F-type H+-transporting ATPase subunit b